MCIFKFFCNPLYIGVLRKKTGFEKIIKYFVDGEKQINLLCY